MNDETLTKSMARFVANSRDKVRKHGFVVLTVPSAPNDPSAVKSFTYSIGLARMGHPEIFVVNFGRDLAEAMIRGAADLIRDEGVDFSEPCLADRIARGYKVAFRPISDDQLAGRFTVARLILGTDFKAVQMFIPDVRGLFPWQEKVDAGYAKLQSAMFTFGDDVPTRVVTKTH